MHFKVTSLSVLIVLCSFIGKAQRVFTSRLTVDAAMRDTFTFQKQWAYNWYLSTDEDGMFSSGISDKVLPADTVHQYFTAAMQTNVQGGYALRYCNAVMRSDTLVLNFADGLPAYASSFSAYMVEDSVCFEPHIAYPSATPGRKRTYRVDKALLTLNRRKYLPGDVVMGYADFVFAEIETSPDDEVQETILYLRGYIRTKIKLPGRAKK
ncbi:MAG: hypothetical protein V4649_06150 [Bacteroidota bacterium]